VFVDTVEDFIVQVSAKTVNRIVYSKKEISQIPLEKRKRKNVPVAQLDKSRTFLPSRLGVQILSGTPNM
jgi:hypothetical protein